MQIMEIIGSGDGGASFDLNTKVLTAQRICFRIDNMAEPSVFTTNPVLANKTKPKMLKAKNTKRVCTSDLPWQEIDSLREEGKTGREIVELLQGRGILPNGYPVKALYSQIHSRKVKEYGSSRDIIQNT